MSEMEIAGRAGAVVLEREAELAELDSVFTHARRGQGCVAVLEGPAGEGKSTLLTVAAGRAQAAGLSVLSARGGVLEREFPFGVMRQLFEPVLAHASATRRAELLDGAAAPAEQALGLEAPEAGAGIAEGPAALHALYWLTVNLAAGGPLVLAVDDAHWADVSSLRALDYIARRIADLPAALVVTLRPDEPDAPAHVLEPLLGAPGAVRERLRPLGRESVAQIVRGRIPEADDATCRAVHEATAGNPLYLQELLRSVTLDGNRPGDLAFVDVGIPSLGDSVVRRIAHVAPGAPALARAMAVLGDGTRLETAASLAGLDRDEAGRIAHQLRRIEVLSVEDPFAFVHPLVLRSVYDAMSVTERDAAHEAAGNLLAEAGAPAEVAAAHLAALAPNGSTVVATALMTAGQRAVAQAAPDEARRWFGRALAEQAQEPPSAWLLAQLGMTEATLRDGAAIGHLNEALAQAEDASLRTHVATALADVLVLSGRWDEAMDVVTRQRRALAADDDEGLAQLAAVELMVAAYSPRLASRSDLDPGALVPLAMGPSWASHALAAALAVRAAHRGEPTKRVLELVDRALEGDVLMQDPRPGIWSISNALIALIDVDEYERALALSDALIASAHRAGSTSAVILASDHRGWIHARMGNLALAEAELRPGVEMALEAGMPTVAATQFFYLQDALLERPSLGDLADVVESFDGGPAIAGTWPAAALSMTRGRLRLARRDQWGGLEDLRRTAEVSLDMGPGVWPLRSALALALPPADRAEALSLAHEELELARTAGLARPHGIALRTLGMLEGREAGIAHLTESVELLESSAARLELSRALVELGAALRRGNRRADARAPLRAGLELARECGAPRLASRASDEIKAAGGRVPQDRSGGREALTASELRVARLAADGATNPQIAQELFVSLKTVETHLSRAYGKLGLSGRGSRTRLNEALGPRRLAS
jgi:DNA-binding CsgD family transcriptional regulator